MDRIKNETIANTYSLKIWVVEYSVIQGCFHYDTLDALMETNRRAIERGIQPQYVPIAVAQSADECVLRIKEESHGML